MLDGLRSGELLLHRIQAVSESPHPCVREGGAEHFVRIARPGGFGAATTGSFLWGINHGTGILIVYFVGRVAAAAAAYTSGKGFGLAAPPNWVP